IDTGNTKFNDQAFRAEANKLIKYFLASLTVPDKDVWVNLSPYEKDRIVPKNLGVTEMGRDLLAQDYMLKQITSSLIYPEKEMGKEFWGKVYAKAQKMYGNTNIPVNTFNKVWIVPDKAVVWEHEGSAYVVESHLKVMLEQDFLSLSKNTAAMGLKSDSKDVNQLGSEVVREVVLPALTKEVNEGKNFANLRQIFHSMILATWYKKNLQESILGKIYVNKSKTAGVDVDDKQIKQKIYEQYLQAFKKGVYNYIKEDMDAATKQPIPRKYFSGGVRGLAWRPDGVLTVWRGARANDLPAEAEILNADGAMKSVTVGVGAAMRAASPDNSMTAVVSETEQNFYTQVPADQIPSAFNVPLAERGLRAGEFWLAEVDPSIGELKKPASTVNPLKDPANLVGVSTGLLQALAGAGHSGVLDQILGRKSTAFDKEIDASAVKVGRSALEALAKELDIVIIVGGNEGSFRDQSKDMPVGLIINPNGKNGIYMYFGDSVEVTNGVKRSIGRPGTSSMVTLVPLMIPSTDGYRISMAVDKFNPNKPFPRIDPVITSHNTLRHVLEQLADYMDVTDRQAFFQQMISEYTIVTLDRPRHDQLKAQAQELGFEVAEREDGDPLLFIRAMLGIKGKDGKKLLAFSTGGGNEHIMSMIFAALYGKALATSIYAATQTLRSVDREFVGEKAGWGSLNRAREYTPGDLQNYADINAALDTARAAGFQVPQGPVTAEQLNAHLLTPDSPELSGLKNGTPAAFVIASNTGANAMDWGVLQPYMQPVTWRESVNGSGTVVVSGFLISNDDDKVYFFRAGLDTDDVVASRYSIVAHNDLLPNPLITAYERTRKPYVAMLASGKVDFDVVDAYVHNVRSLLSDDPGAGSVLRQLGSAVGNQEFARAIHEVETYILGNPTIAMEDGTIHHIVQYADAAALARGDRRSLDPTKLTHGGIALDSAMLNLQVRKDGKGVPLPISQQPIGAMMKMIEKNGIQPFILEVRPFNLPPSLGANTEKPSKQNQLSKL
ncbi:MAG: fructose-bisphosphatase class II, partial [Candidatus Omnitrophica bacterium]|nr:fructose-bisphosphatase class II [Candidatus Omnitrophota bacterium]